MLAKGASRLPAFASLPDGLTKISLAIADEAKATKASKMIKELSPRTERALFMEIEISKVKSSFANSATDEFTIAKSEALGATREDGTLIGTHLH